MPRVAITDESTVVGTRTEIALGPFFDPAKPETEQMCERIATALEQRGYVPMRITNDDGTMTMIGRRREAPASPEHHDEPTDQWEGA